MLTSKDFFYCYNKKVSDFLESKGLHKITVGINPNNKKPYSMYHKTELLQKALKEYSHN